MPEYLLANVPDKQIEIFSDLNTKTPWQGSRVKNLEAVVRAIFNAIRQPPYQRMFDPTGFDLEVFLFRLNTSVIEEKLRNYMDYISKDDPRYEPIAQETRIINIDKDNHLVTIRIGFRLSQDGNNYTFVGRIRV